MKGEGEIRLNKSGPWIYGDVRGFNDLIPNMSLSSSSGLFFVRRSKWSVDFLNTWWNQTAFVRFGSSKSGDNDALKHLIKQLPPDELRNHVRIPPMQCIFNSYPWIPTWKTALRLFSSPSTIWNGIYLTKKFAF